MVINVFGYLKAGAVSASSAVISSCESSIAVALILSSNCAVLLTPIITVETTCFAKSHAIDTAAGLTFFCCAIALILSTTS